MQQELCVRLNELMCQDPVSNSPHVRGEKLECGNSICEKGRLLYAADIKSTFQT